MPPLKNIRHEKFAQAVINSPTQAEAYIKSYPNVIDSVGASNSASRLLDSVSIRQRIQELLQQNEHTSPNGITKRLNELIASENEGIAIQAINTGMKAYHVFDDGPISTNIENINVVFADVNPQIGLDEKSSSKPSVATTHDET